MRRLTDALVAAEGSGDGFESSPQVLFNVLSALLSTDFGRLASAGRLLIDPSLAGTAPCGACSREASLLRHLWYAAVNWSVRSAPGGAASAASQRCLVQWARLVRRRGAACDLVSLAAQPWILGVAGASHPSAPCLELINEAASLSTPGDVMHSNAAGALHFRTGLFHVLAFFLLLPPGSFGACYEDVKRRLGSG